MTRKKEAQDRLTTAQRHPREAQHEIASPEAESELAALTAKLEATLQAAEVAHEELRQQNEELTDTREALEMQRHRYLSLFEHAPYGYVITDPQGVIEEANQAAAALLRAPAWALEGKPLLIFLSREDRNRLQGLLHGLLCGEPMGDIEVLLRPRGGRTVPAVLTAVRDLDHLDNAVRLRWMVRDLSQSRATEEALRQSEERLRHSQRLESIGRLAGGIAHSFNNLLAAISFHSEILAEQLGPDDPRCTHVEGIQKAGERAAVLARQLLAFGRKQILQPRVLRLGEVIREMAPMLRRVLGENIELDVRLDPEPGAVHVDLGQLEQVILNLVVNARDAMSDGGRLTLGATDAEVAADRQEAPDLPPGPYLKLWVADTGAGIEPEVMARLFEPFFTTKERDKGTGLGLATVHGIVHQSGGGIAVASQPGEGACFTVYLPRVEPPAAVEPLRPPPARRRARNGSEVVLLVEDEENIRLPAIEVLEARGYKVLQAADAAEALARSGEHAGHIHLLITDVIMPGMSGSQLARRLIAARPDMRILYISGYPEDAIAHHGVLDAEKSFLQKPFSPATLLDKVREILDAAVPAR